MNRHVFFMLTVCVVAGITPLIFSSKNNMFSFILITYVALFVQTYWRDMVVQMLILRGYYVGKSNNHNKLIQIYEKIYKLMPHSFAGKMAKGVIHSLQENWGHAETYFRQALYLKPGNLNVSLNLAVVLMRREYYQEVVKLLKSLIYAYPQCVFAYKILGEAFYHLGEPHEARDCLRIARLIDKNDLEVKTFLYTIEKELKEVA